MNGEEIVEVLMAEKYAVEARHQTIDPGSLGNIKLCSNWSNQRGDGRGIWEEKGEGFSRTSMKETWTNLKVGQDQGMAGVGGRGGGEMETTVLEQQ